jgi:hypothetical protein
MVRHIATVSAVIYFFALPNALNAFAPVTPVSLKHVASHQLNLPSKTHTRAPRIVSTEQRAVSLASIDTSSLTQYLLETVISNGVPAFFWIAVVAFAAKSFKSAKESSNGGPNGGLFSQTSVTEIYDDLYGSPEPQRPMLPFGPRGGNSKPKNLGIPTDQYLKIIKLNDKYQSFDYSLMAATQSKAKAAAKYRSQAFDSALQRSFDSSIEEIRPAQKSDLLTEEKAFLREGGKMLNNLVELQGRLTELVIRDEMKSMDVEIGEMDAHSVDDEKDVIDATIVEEEKDKAIMKKSEKKKNSNKKDISKLVKEIEKQNTDLLKLEMEFIRGGTCRWIVFSFILNIQTLFMCTVRVQKDITFTYPYIYFSC